MTGRPEPLPGLLDTPIPGETERMVEAILFASAEPLSLAQIDRALPEGADARPALDALRLRYRDRGVHLVQVGAGWAFRTAPDLGFLMQAQAQETRKLSRAAIETLSIIAYHQPVTRAEIEEIRGVSASRGTFDTLLELGWIRLGKRRETPGRPVTFATTEGFLDAFGLGDTRDLPGLKDLRAAGLLGQPAPGQGEATPEATGSPPDDAVSDGHPSAGALPDENAPDDPAGT